MQIEHAIFGEKRFTEDQLQEIRWQLFDREQEFRGYAVRYARVLKHAMALQAPDLREVAEIAAGLATAELRIDAPQKVCEIARGEHLDKRGFARIVPDDHRIFVRFDDVCACRIAITALHECRHRWQVIHGRFIGMYARGESEPDAEGFAAGIMQRYHFQCGGCGKSY